MILLLVYLKMEKKKSNEEKDDEIGQHLLEFGPPLPPPPARLRLLAARPRLGSTENLDSGYKTWPNAFSHRTAAEREREQKLARVCHPSGSTSSMATRLGPRLLAPSHQALKSMQ